MALATLLDDAPADTTTPPPATTTKPKPPTGGAADAAPTGPLPVAAPPPASTPAPASSSTSPAAGAGDVKPPPLSTTDPLAFAPAPAPNVNNVAANATNAAGQVTVPGTQSPTAPNGQLGYGSVPYSNGQLTNLGGGMWAPTNNSGQGISVILPSGMTFRDWAAGTPGSIDPATGMWHADGTPAPVLPPASGGEGYADEPTFSQVAPGANNPNLVPAGGPPHIIPDTTPPATGGGGSTTTTPPAGGGSSGTPPATGTTPVPGDYYGPGVNTTPTTVENSLTNQTIRPGEMADRFAIARQQLNDTLTNQLNPQFEADQRRLNRYNFGAGRGVSGAARTSQGDLLEQHQRDINQLSSNFLNNALTGSIDDAYKNIGIATQQQGFQNQQQQQAFNNALQEWMAGNGGDLEQLLNSLRLQNQNTANSVT